MQQGATSIETQLLHGNSAGAIVYLVQEASDNLVVMTTHGRSGMGGWVLGSVTDRVVRESGDPVLVIRPSRWEHDLLLRISPWTSGLITSISGHRSLRMGQEAYLRIG